MQLSLTNLSRSFGGLKAVQDVNLVVEPGRITGLIGPNGAGKTTVINLMSGFLRPTSGTIKLGDEDISTLPPQEVARLGVVRTFQNVRLLPSETVKDNILAGFHLHDNIPMVSKLLGLPAVARQDAAFRAECDKLLGEFDMRRYADALAGGLSYGHQRRVEIMRAMAMRPRVILFDEPAAGMNDVEANEIGAIFRQLADSGLAVLLVEHNLRLVLSQCHIVYVMNSGAIIAQGTPDAIRAHPRVVEAYIGS